MNKSQINSKIIELKIERARLDKEIIKHAKTVAKLNREIAEINNEIKLKYPEVEISKKYYCAKHNTNIYKKSRDNIPHD